MINSISIGWDVGGWNCDKNSNSRDALVVLDSSGAIKGTWRGNLRATINAAISSVEFVSALMKLCKAEVPTQQVPVTMAIDTPLGFSEDFVRLVNRGAPVAVIGAESGINSYLFRHTERHLFERGLRPLSPVKDMIGSQATKGMHVLAKFTPVVQACGVWSDGSSFTAIEAYPSACKNSATIAELRLRYPSLGHDDVDDALTCALIAQLHSSCPEQLLPPTPDAPISEGWIWVPSDAFAH